MQHSAPAATRRIARRVIVLAVVAAQLALIVRAYDADHAFFGFQMFPESSEWQAEIVRIEADGAAIDVRDPWPGGYRWGELVTGRGLDVPWFRHHADAGLRSTLHFLDEALQWVADHTPDDERTVRLEARVTYWDNGQGPFTTVLTTETRR